MAVAKLAAWLGALLILPTVAGFFGEAWWFLDLFAHFRVQYAVVALILLGVASVRPRRITLFPALPLVVNLACIAPLYLRSEPEPRLELPPLVVASFNVHTANPAKAEVVEFLDRSGADVVFLYEVDHEWMSALRQLDPSYQVVVSRPERHNFGIAALARIPIASYRVLVLSEAMVPSIELTLEWHGRELVLLGTHALPPVDAEYTAARDEQLARIASWSKGERRPHALFGDLNATPWAAPFRRLIAESRLRDSARGFAPTWPHFDPLLAPLRIPIDHALLSDELTAGRRIVGPSCGSDHRSLLVDILVHSYQDT